MLCIQAMLMLALEASAQTLVVNTTSDSGSGSLREQVAAASNGATIVFDGSLGGSTISLTSGEILIDKDLTISGLGADSLTISGSGNSRIFRIAPQNTVNISDLALEDGVAAPPLPQGGAVRNSGNLTLSDCRIANNTVPPGTSSRSGGGVINASSNGGSALLVIERCEIIANTAAGEGGGVANITFETGGAADLMIRDSTIADNSAGFGGGVATYAQFGGSVQTRIENSTISGNLATSDGGAFDLDVLADGFLAQLIVAHTTVHANEANGRGGALSFFNDGSSATFRNSIIAGNTAAGDGDDIFRGSSEAGLTFDGGNLVGSAEFAGSYGQTPSDLIGSDDDTPIDPMLGVLQDNGGSTPTHRPAIGSPAVELATGLHCLDPDQRGIARPFDGDNDGSAACDSGAVELNVPLYSIAGSVNGLEGTGLILQNNNTDDLAITSDGAFEFPTSLPDGAAYDVNVSNQPSDPNQACSITNGSGIVAGNDVNDIAVDCVTEQYTVGGTVSGLQGSGLMLQNNGGDDLAISADGPFTFPTALDDGSAYSVTVATQPSDPSQTCHMISGSGKLSGADVTDVEIICTTDAFTIGGTVSGLSGAGLTLRNNGNEYLGITSNGAFEFDTPVPDHSSYDVTIFAQPVGPAQTCDVNNAAGTVDGSDVNTVTVQCIDDAAAMLLPEALSFGNVMVGEIGMPEPLIVTSTGEAPLDVQQVSLAGANAGAYLLTQDLCSGQSLAPGESCDLTLDFAPSTPGLKLASLEVVTNGPHDPYRATLAGDAIDSDTLLASSFE